MVAGTVSQDIGYRQNQRQGIYRTSVLDAEKWWGYDTFGIILEHTNRMDISTEPRLKLGSASGKVPNSQEGYHIPICQTWLGLTYPTRKHMPTTSPALLEADAKTSGTYCATQLLDVHRVWHDYLQTALRERSC